jgi:hypothetical protein
MSAAATITRRNATTRTATSRVALPSGSPNTTIPAGIADAFPAIEVTAITGTAGPI